MIRIILLTLSLSLSLSWLQFSVEIDPVEGVEVAYELPLWIIISAAVAGIVLLGIIILILWKVRLPVTTALITLHFGGV